MWDRYDPRSTDDRDRGDSWDRSFGSRGSAGDRDHDGQSRDVFTRDLDLPRGHDREQVRERNRLYEIDGDESRALATIGAGLRSGEMIALEWRDVDLGKRQICVQRSDGTAR